MDVCLACVVQVRYNFVGMPQIDGLDALRAICVSRAMKISMTKRCVKCNEVKPLEKFGRDVRALDGRASWCNRCHNYAQYQRHRVTRPDRLRTGNRRRHVRHRYGITIEAVDALLKKQRGRCAICKVKAIGDSRMHRLHVDHDHKTHTVRGLLCFHCNAALGMLRDDARIAKNAWRYLHNAAR